MPRYPHKDAVDRLIQEEAERMADRDRPFREDELLGTAPPRPGGLRPPPVTDRTPQADAECNCSMPFGKHVAGCNVEFRRSRGEFDASLGRHPAPQADADVIREALFWIERGNEGSFHYERGIEALDRLVALLAEKDAQIEEDKQSIRTIVKESGRIISRQAAELAEARAEIERLNNKLNTDSQTFQIECQKAEIQMRTEQRDALAAQVRTLTEALEKIAGPHDDRVMKQARTLHYDMAWWAQQALASVQQPPAMLSEFIKKHGRLPIDLVELTND